MDRDVSFDEAIAFADGASAAAGHQVTDPELREIIRRSYEGEITSDQAVELMKERVVAMRDERA